MAVWAVLTASMLLFAAVVVAACAPLTTFNALIPADSGGEVAKAGIAYGESARQKLDVYVPVNAAAAAPVVIFFYGGSWNSGDRDGYAFVGKALAARGFVVIIPDYRLVPTVHFPEFLSDAASAVAWTRQKASQYGGDPNKIYVMGHSAGAYIAAMIALDARYLRAVGSDPSQLRGVIGLAGPYDFLPLDSTATIAAFSKAPDLNETQPVNFVTANAPPMLLATGDDDTTVYPRNTLSLADKLRAAGRPVTVQRYKGIAHIGIMLALSRPLRDRAPVLDDITQFMKAN
jgi:acetyl esterase/lipase